MLQENAVEFKKINRTINPKKKIIIKQKKKKNLFLLSLCRCMNNRLNYKLFLPDRNQYY